MDAIRIRGARTHNLRNIDLDLPRDRLIVITGLSGSGKSSLAFDTLYAEGQRRYVESLSAYARQFLARMEKPDVDHIEGLSPAISIEQKSTSHNPRSTVGTVTEIHDYLRLLFARAGIPHCPDHGVALEARTISQMVDDVLALPAGRAILILAPVVRGRKGEHAQLLEARRAEGFVRARIDGAIHELDALPTLDKRRNHTIEIVVDRLRVRADIRQRLAESLETAVALSDGLALIAPMEAAGEAATSDDAAAADAARAELLFSARYACPECGYSVAEMEPRLFSFNNPAGACPACDGLGVQQYFDPHRVVAHPELSLAGGAVRGWDRRNIWHFHFLRSLAAHYRFDIETPYRELPEAIRTMLLYGSGDESIRFRYPGGGRTRAHPFEGILPTMERRYRETDSNMVREELARFLDARPCPDCDGSRLRREARHVLIDGRSPHAISRLPIGEAERFFRALQLPGRRGRVAERIVREISERLRFLVNVGLDYLSLERSAETLSGGEAQRIRLASQIGAGLVGVLYVLDEPSIGLHQRDNKRLLETLIHLRDLGNTVIVVEHDEEAIRCADHVVDMGPGAGAHGGQVVAEGSPEAVAAGDSLTGQYLSGRRAIPLPAQRVAPRAGQALTIRGAAGNNLRAVDVELPAGLMICVAGVSGSGKSTLINDTLYRIAAARLNGAQTSPAPCAGVDGLELFDKAINIDQSPIGRTPRSNPATYTGLFGPLRELFAATPEARARGYAPGRFSFNVKGGRCEACQGDGVIRVAMHFLADIYVPCDICRGRRYNRETLEIRYKGKNIREVLEMTIEEAHDFFAPIPAAARKLRTLVDVGLSYIRLGQNATTLSGGEAQRVKLARELAKRDTGRTLYVLDEPTTGLHFADVERLLSVLLRLRDHGNTVVVIEHNLDVLKSADWIIDLGPEGGGGGGRVVATGTPEQITAVAESHTGRFLRETLEKGAANATSQGRGVAAS